MTEETKLQLDLRDLSRIRDGLETYARLNAEEYLNRVAANNNEVFCNVAGYDGSGMLMCTRDGYNAIIELAQRHRESMPAPEDYSLEELVDGIRKHVVRVMVDENNDELALSRLLAEVVSNADRRHVERTYHFPCVVVHHQDPPQFRIGIVTFTSAKAFPQAFAPALQGHVKSSLDEKFATEQVEKFKNYVASSGWIASVTVPPCAPESAKPRAELAVTTAINAMRLLFGVHYGRDMRVTHLAFAQPSNTQYAVTQNGMLDVIWSGKASGAAVEENWCQSLSLDKHREFWNDAAHLLAVTLQGKRSEIAERVLDALTWFGESAFESAPGVQTVNFVAALERLTTKGWFSAHQFCSRVAILAHNDDTDFEKMYWDSYDIHTARSEVVHGSYSPRSPESSKAVRLAHDLTRNALFRALELHSFLRMRGTQCSLADLHRFFDQQYSKWSTVLKELETQCKSRTAKKQKIAKGHPVA